MDENMLYAVNQADAVNYTVIENDSERQDRRPSVFDLFVALATYVMPLGSAWKGMFVDMVNSTTFNGFEIGLVTPFLYSHRDLSSANEYNIDNALKHNSEING